MTSKRRSSHLPKLLAQVEGGSIRTEAIDPLLSLVVGGKFDIQKKYLIQDAGGLQIIIDAVDHCSSDVQAQIWSVLAELLTKSVHNVDEFVRSGLTGKVLDKLIACQDDNVAGKIAVVLGLLMKHNITVKELKSLITALKGREGKFWPRHAHLLISVLQTLPHSHVPDAFFHFNGSDGAAITLPPLARWPGTSGFTISMWVRMEPNPEADMSASRPVLYWFRTGKGLGYSAYFSGFTLILESASKTNKKLQFHQVEKQLLPYQWYMVTIVYIYHRIVSSEAHCYVNGQFASAGELTFVSVKDPFDKCFLGTSPGATRDDVFCGQMSTVYLFQEPLTEATIAALFKLGPSYRSHFKYSAESDVPMTAQEKKLLYDSRLSSSIVFMYNPMACDGQLCLEASPTENPSFFVHSPHATMLEGVRPVVTQSIDSALHSIGGVQAIFPLFSQLDFLHMTSSDERKCNYGVCATLWSLVCDRLSNSVTHQQQMVQNRGFLLISHLLQKVSPQHLTEEVLDLLLNFARHLILTPSRAALLQDLLHHIFFNPDLWIHTEAKIQIKLLSSLVTEFVVPTAKEMLEQSYHVVNVRQQIGVPRLMYILKHYYWIKLPPGAAKGLGVRPSSDEMQFLRSFLLLIVKYLVSEGKGITVEEMVSLLRFVTTVHEEESLLDVLQLLLSLATEKADQFVPVFDQSKGMRALFALFESENEEVWIFSLKLLGIYLHHLPTKYANEITEEYSIFRMIAKKMAAHRMPISVSIYNALYEVMIDKVSNKITKVRRKDAEPDVTIRWPAVIPAIVQLLLWRKDDVGGENVRTQSPESSASDCEDSGSRLSLCEKISLLLLTDLTLLTANHNNCRVLMSRMGWQKWLVCVGEIACRVGIDGKLSQLAFGVFQNVISYAVYCEREGWRVWAETIALINVQLNDEQQQREFRERLQRMASQSPEVTRSGSLQASQTAMEVTIEHTVVECAEMFQDQTDGEAATDDLNSKTSTLCTEESSTHNGEPPISSGEKFLSVEEKKEFNEDGGDFVSATDKRDKLRKSSSPVFSDSVPLVSGQGFVPSPTFPFTSRSLSNTSTSGVASYRFSWSPIHQQLLSNLLGYILAHLESWKQTSEKSMTEFAVEKENAFFVSNIAHVLSLTADNMIVAAGGIDKFMQRASVDQRSYSFDVSGSAVSEESALAFIAQMMKIGNLLVFGTIMDFSNVEAARKMVSGGIVRQCMRLLLCHAASEASANSRYIKGTFSAEKDVLSELDAQVSALLGEFGQGSDQMGQYMRQVLQDRVKQLYNSQSILSLDHVNMITAALHREKESSEILNTLAMIVLHFVAELTVTSYSHLVSVHESPMPSPVADRVVKHMVEEQMMGGMSPWRTRRSRSSTGDTPGLKKLKSLIPDKLSLSLGKKEELSPSPVSPHAPEVKKVVGGEPATQEQTVDVAEEMKALLVHVTPLLSRLFTEFKPFFTKTLCGSQDQELMTKAFFSVVQSDSPIELVMLLSSQEWQNALQVHAGLAFAKLVKEGGQVQRIVEAWLLQIGQRIQLLCAKEEGHCTVKHAAFEELCSTWYLQCCEDETAFNHSQLALQQRYQNQAHQIWMKVSDVLMNKHGAWGSPEDNSLSFMRLDTWEDDSRRRMRLIKNPHGSTHAEAIVYPTTFDEADTRSIEAAREALRLKLALADKEPDVLSNTDSDEAEIGPEEIDLEQKITFSGKVVLSCQCSVIAPCVQAPGSLTITTSAIYFTADEDSEEYQHIDPKVLLYTNCLHSEWSLTEIKGILMRRYLFQSNAVEIFFARQGSILFLFDDSKMVKKIVRSLPRVGAGHPYGLPLTRATSLASPMQLFRKSNMTHRWQHGEVSNFAYLMFLNTIAGRTYNDLNQYPVFPWILNNFTSQQLDLSEESNYRDLSKPIGALNERRLKYFEERYEMWDDDTIPPFFYGTHYSNMAITLGWLIRMEPFATQFLQFQSGKFDQPGRTFASVPRALDNCMQDTSDVKELIPELFYLPEMFLNKNQFVFGVDEDGHNVNDVELPPWASNAEEFIHIHRQALESDYVSAHLHEWIDLIFGYKQRGDEAVLAKNVFYYLTYEGSVDLDAIEDVVTRRAVEMQIRHFGQTPAQLLTRPHPRKLTLELGQTMPRLESDNLRVLATIAVTHDIPIASVHALTSPYAPSPVITAISCNQAFAVNSWSLTASADPRIPPSLTITPDPALGSAVMHQRRLGEPLDQRVTPSSACFTLTGDHKYILACGYWDSSYKCFSTDTGRMVQSVFGHHNIVTCISYSPQFGFPGSFSAVTGDGLVASGSLDATVLIWQYSARVQRIVGYDEDDVIVNSRAILTGHEHPIICLAVSGSHGLVVSGSQGGTCLLHTIDGDLLYSLSSSLSLSRPHLAAISCNGHVILEYSDSNGYLVVYSCNGMLLAHQALEEHLLAMTISADGGWIVSGGFGKQIVVRRLHNLKVTETFPPCSSTIRSLDLTHDQLFVIVGLASGHVIVIPLGLKSFGDVRL
ncbi:neurobeachin-like isoform X2 [Corticium candelabrum]|uniref:neurobeachin-like isoform X2 n=1 Tax=Corticium candelabrum TaxID=121492 RepID=UPI002E269D50|nr:neurobeachin-like isoform X2 [Corticium candelabrum]